jgi:hypothetical protein
LNRQALEVASFLDKCAELISAEIPFLKAMDIAARSIPDPELGNAFLEMKQKMESGQGITDTFSEYPALFTPLNLAIINMSEQHGRLEEGFQRVARSLKGFESPEAKPKPEEKPELPEEAKPAPSAIPSLAVLVHPVKETAKQLAEINKNLAEMNSHLAKISQQIEILNRKADTPPASGSNPDKTP